MDALLVALAVAAWLLLMVSAALVLFAGGAGVDAEVRTAPPILALPPPWAPADDAGHAAA